MRGGVSPWDISATPSFFPIALEATNRNPLLLGEFVNEGEQMLHLGETGNNLPSRVAPIEIPN